MKWKSMILSAALLTALTVTPANALDYTIDSPTLGTLVRPPVTIRCMWGRRPPPTWTGARTPP